MFLLVAPTGNHIIELNHYETKRIQLAYGTLSNCPYILKYKDAADVFHKNYSIHDCKGDGLRVLHRFKIQAQEIPQKTFKYAPQTYCPIYHINK